MRAGYIQGRVIAQKWFNFCQKLRENRQKCAVFALQIPYFDQMRVIVEGGL